MADAPAREEGAFCPVYAALNLLQEKWTLHIIRALLEGPDLTDMRLVG
jgi:DNA-binding HxlR family transcriptional regulator